MILGKQLDELASIRQPVILVPGSFDGVHRGHQSLIAYARQQAEPRRGQVWVMTFDPHPSHILRPENPKAQLMTREQKIAALAELPADGCLMLPFDETFSRIEPEAFVTAIHQACPTLFEVVIGPNYAFGRHARGTPELLGQLGEQHGFTVKIMEPLMLDDDMVSSSRIRRHVLAGDLRTAGNLLGAPWRLTGPVIAGQQVGRQWGFPTANL
ncbi:MAG: adenylyltransferase/cytidyltransferase family protein, partial [Verrucomicrobiota bacterium]